MEQSHLMLKQLYPAILLSSLHVPAGTHDAADFDIGS